MNCYLPAEYLEKYSNLSNFEIVSRLNQLLNEITEKARRNNILNMEKHIKIKQLSKLCRVKDKQIKQLRESSKKRFLYLCQRNEDHAIYRVLTPDCWLILTQSQMSQLISQNSLPITPNTNEQQSVGTCGSNVGANRNIETGTEGGAEENGNVQTIEKGRA